MCETTDNLLYMFSRKYEKRNFPYHSCCSIKKTLVYCFPSHPHEFIDKRGNMPTLRWPSGSRYIAIVLLPINTQAYGERTFYRLNSIIVLSVHCGCIYPFLSYGTVFL